jgi:hypothetical protein
MQTRDRRLSIANKTLQTLMVELGDECQMMLALLNQLQLPNLSAEQRSNILAELLASSIHLHTHCDEDFQNLIAEELEALPDDTSESNEF